MRDVIISKSLYHLNSIYNYDNDTFDRVKYGLEILYISITKTLIILGIAAMFGCFIDTLLFFLLITPLKTFSYGLHAKNSIYCYILSIIVFIIIPQIILNFNINFNIIIKIVLSIFSLLCYYSHMLSYQHSYHAGNHADILKHFVLFFNTLIFFRI